MTRAAERIAELVASIDAKLAAADHPLELRMRDGRPERLVRSIDARHSRVRSWWVPVDGFVSTLLIKGHRYGLKPDSDDDIPF